MVMETIKLGKSVAKKSQKYDFYFAKNCNEKAAGFNFIMLLILNSFAERVQVKTVFISQI